MRRPFRRIEKLWNVRYCPDQHGASGIAGVGGARELAHDAKSAPMDYDQRASVQLLVKRHGENKNQQRIRSTSGPERTRS